MAFDHVSMMFNAGRGGEELWTRAPAPPRDFSQFLARFSGVSVAPGFCFMAGFMVALTSLSREARGVPRAEVTSRLLIRGLVLIAVDTLIMGLPRALMGFYSFMVLACIGTSIILLALLRHLPSGVLLGLAIAILGLHPLIDVSGLPVLLRAIIHEPVREGAIRSLYPVIPWVGLLFLGFSVGKDAYRRERPTGLWLALSGLCLALFFAIRLGGGYGNAYPHHGIGHLDFWYFAKYPPDLPFLTWSLFITFALLAGLQTLCKNGVPWVLSPFVAFGRVPFFFYVVHFYLLGPIAAALRWQVGLSATFGIWVLLLGVMFPISVWYFEKKRDRPNLVTRYL